VTRFRFVEAEAAQFPVSLLCKTVGVTRQGFYAWKRRPPSARELADRELGERIRQIYSETEQIYGAPRIYSELKLGDGVRVGKKRGVCPIFCVWSGVTDRPVGAGKDIHDRHRWRRTV
jgi:putative transposase